MSAPIRKPLQRIAYIHLGTFPSNQVHTIQVMRMCEGLQQAGYSPILIGRASPSTTAEENEPNRIFEHYGIQHPFDVQLLRFPEFESWPKFLRAIFFFIYAAYFVLRSRKYHPDVIYTRDPYTALLSILTRTPFIIEEHAPPLNRMQTWLRRGLYQSRFLSAVVFISHSLQKLVSETDLLSKCRAPVVVAHDAAATWQIRTNISSALEQRFPASIHIGYVGSLLPGRGIDLILAIAQRLPEFRFRIVGGKPAEIRQLSSLASANVVWRGFVPPGSIEDEFSTLDTLLMPYQEDTATQNGARSARWMSPLKMFEYMASGTPLIASDLPVLREVLTSEQNCILAPAADIEAWIQAIVRLATNGELRVRLATAARNDVLQTYNWVNRAQAVLQAAQRGGNQ